jgi:hypothetical protein
MSTSVASQADRVAALRWLARQLQWERILDHLRGGGGHGPVESDTPRAA